MKLIGVNPEGTPTDNPLHKKEAVHHLSESLKKSSHAIIEILKRGRIAMIKRGKANGHTDYDWLKGVLPPNYPA